ncbi:MAG: STAS domain-containing protein [Bacteroidetes bacterium]|nr:STAS domain-containing protein [Bacteroidota bacterium]
MFAITVGENGEVLLSGRFDASQVGQAAEVLDSVRETCRVNFKDLDYISSAGLGVLLKTQKRLTQTGNRLILTNMNKLVRDVFRIARFDFVFTIEEGGS